MPMQIAVYPGTFDPITNGHTDLVERAARRFDRVIVAIHSSSSKAPAFGWEERIELAREVLSDQQNVVVEGFQGLLVDFVREHRAGVIALCQGQIETLEHVRQPAVSADLSTLE